MGLDTVTDGTSPVLICGLSLEFLSGFKLGTVSLLVSLRSDGAGTTPLIPSGSLDGFGSSFASNLSPAPPTRGLKTLYANAALRRTFATSAGGFFLTIGPKPGRWSSSSLGDSGCTAGAGAGSGSVTSGGGGGFDCLALGISGGATSGGGCGGSGSTFDLIIGSSVLKNDVCAFSGGGA